MSFFKSQIDKVKNGDLSKWDVSLLIMVLSNSLYLLSPKQRADKDRVNNQNDKYRKWNYEQDHPYQKTLQDAITVIRNCRNEEYGHIPSTDGLEQQTFTQQAGNLKGALMDLSVCGPDDIAEIDADPIC